MLVKAASEQSLIRELSTVPEAAIAVGRRNLQFRNTNALVRDPSWAIGLQKTGYISEAGRCVVMQAQMAGRKLIMVLLDSAGRYSRIGDAERLRAWLTNAALPSIDRDAPAGAPLPTTGPTTGTTTVPAALAPSAVLPSGNYGRPLHPSLGLTPATPAVLSDLAPRP
jgi:D-alanyl-D-alanine endopeptidase (penicillin-binding protein 7)